MVLYTHLPDHFWPVKLFKKSEKKHVEVKLHFNTPRQIPAKLFDFFLEKDQILHSIFFFEFYKILKETSKSGI